MEIYKYTIPIQDEVEIEMKKDTHILCVKNQREQLCIWALCSPDAEDILRSFRVYGTGHEIEQGKSAGMYIGTAVFQNGALIWHLFAGRWALERTF